MYSNKKGTVISENIFRRHFYITLKKKILQQFNAYFLFFLTLPMPKDGGFLLRPPNCDLNDRLTQCPQAFED